MKSLFLSITIIAMVSTCKKDSRTTEITKIEYGTSFGSCIGYCVKVLTIKEGKISKTLNPSRSTDLPEKGCNKEWNDFHSLASKIDLSLFNKLDETIGCPDCADGGAEWIEITTPAGSKKVTYEYGKAPKEVKSYISDLRRQFDELGECE